MGSVNLKSAYNRILYISDPKYLKTASEKRKLNEIRLFIFDFRSKNKQVPNDQYFQIYTKLLTQEIQILEHIESLYLNLDDIQVQGFLGELINPWMPITHKLKYINLSFQKCNISKSDCNILAQFLDQCLSLEGVCINLQQNWIETEGIENILQKLTNKQDLLHVHIQADDNGIERIGSTLKINPNLFTFKLSLNKSTQFGDKGAVQIYSSLQNCSSLEMISLYLNQCKLGNSGFTYVLQSLKQLENLKVISLEVCQNEISDDGIQNLMELQDVAQNYISLYMSLSENKSITDNGARYLSMLFMKAFKLNYLVLEMEKTTITREGIDMIASQLSQMKDLYNLYMNFGAVHLHAELEHKISQTLNNLKQLNQCIFRPELTPLSTEKTAIANDSASSNMITPVISPFFRIKNFVHIASCCDPYLVFNNTINGTNCENQNLVFNFVFSDPVLSQECIPILINTNQQNNLYFANASKKQLPPNTVCQRITKTVVGILKGTVQGEQASQENLSISKEHQQENLSGEKEHFEEVKIEYIQGSSEKPADNKKKAEFQMTMEEFFQHFNYDENQVVCTISYGTLIHGTDLQSGNKVAIKILKNLNQNQYKIVKKEIELLILLHKDPRVIDLVGYVVNTEESQQAQKPLYTVYIACELGIPLEEFLTQQQTDILFNFYKVVPYLYKIASIGTLLETKRISHCDFGLNSIVVIPSTLDFKLTDFGYLKKNRVTEDLVTKSLEKQNKPEQQQLLPSYNKEFLSPEIDHVVNNPQTRKKIQNMDFEFSKSDIFTFGLVSVYVLLRCNKAKIVQYNKILSDSKEFIPPKLFNILILMLQQKPEKRPTFKQVQNELAQFKSKIGCK